VVRIKLIPLLMLMSASALSCEMYQAPDDQNESVLFHSNSGVCYSLLNGIEYSADKYQARYYFFDQEENDDSAGYWSDWVLQSDTNPIFTQSLATSYVGLGVWVPSELEDRLTYLHPEEWLLSHGLQLSLGFGKKNIGEPRMRLDYRWHDKYEGDFMMQVELPF